MISARVIAENTKTRATMTVRRSRLRSITVEPAAAASATVGRGIVGRTAKVAEAAAARAREPRTGRGGGRWA